MTRTMFLAPAAALLGFALLSGCGTNMEQRAATGAATGLIVAGPVGAAVGAGVGAVVNEADEQDGK
jgi:osmotically inducible lipoprotein OsmB